MVFERELRETLRAELRPKVEKEALEEAEREIR